MTTAHRSARRRAREFVVQGLYQHFVGDQDEASIQTQVAEVGGFDRADRAHYDRLLGESLEHRDALAAQLAPHIDRPWQEVSPVERSILLMATCELVRHADTPYRVIINEAIELAKTYGGVDGHKFVNGVLDKLAAQVRPEEFGAR